VVRHNTIDNIILVALSLSLTRLSFPKRKDKHGHWRLKEMKSVLPLKWVSAVIVALLALSAWADMLVLPPHTMSYAEWMVAMGQNASPLRFPVLCFALAVLRKRPSIMVWLACCASVILFIPVVLGEPWFDITFLSAFGVSTVSWIVSVIFYCRMRRFSKYVWALLAILGVLLAIPIVFAVVAVVRVKPPDRTMVRVGEQPPVDPRPNETYYEYRKRAKRIICNLCPKCDKPMLREKGDWYCGACGYDERVRSAERFIKKKTEPQ